MQPILRGQPSQSEITFEVPLLMQGLNVLETLATTDERIKSLVAQKIVW